MIEKLVQELAFSLEKFGTGAYLIVTLLALLETLILIGQFIPGSIFLLLVGFLCFMDVFEFYPMAVSVVLARVGGEYINYALGRYKGRSMFRADSRFLKPRFLEMAEARFQSGGGNLLVWGQFLGFLRPFITVAAGAANYSLWRFTISVTIGAILWTLVHLVIGYFFGASWQRAVEYLQDFSLVMLVAIPVALLSGWAVRKLLQLSGYLYKFLERLNRAIHDADWYMNLRARHPRIFPFLERRLSLSRNWGLAATVGFASALACLGVCLALYWDVRTLDNWYVFDLTTVNLLAQLRTPGADKLFLVITNFGAEAVMTLVVVLAAALCFFSKQHKSMFVIIGSVLLSLALNLILEQVFQRDRPDASLRMLPADGYSFPSSHATVGFALFAALYYWLWNHPGVLRIRMTLAFVLMLMAFLIGFSRVYLGVHYPSDIVSGFFVGLGAVLACGTIAANWTRLGDAARRADYKAAGLLAVYGFSAWLFTQMQPAKTPLDQETASPADVAASLNELLPHLPRQSTTLFGGQYVPINVVLRGDPEAAVALLQQNGFDIVRPSDFFTRSVANPIFPAFVHGTPALYTLENRREDARDVVRLWHTSAKVGDDDIWLGSVVTHSREIRWQMDTFQQEPDVDLTADRLAQVLAPLSPEKLTGFRPRGLYHWKNEFFTHGDAWFFDL